MKNRNIINKKGFIILLLIVIGSVLAIKILIDNRIKLVYLKPEDTTISEEQFEKDVDTILKLYGLQKDNSRFIDSLYDIHYKQNGSGRKSIFINASPILLASNKEYTEIETLMEIWLYVQSYKFDYPIDGITYYFTAHSIKSAFAPLAPNEIYMSRNEFISLYNEIDGDELSHKEKVKLLTDKYVKKINYKRHSGHVQVRWKTSMQSYFLYVIINKLHIKEDIWKNLLASQ